MIIDSKVRAITLIRTKKQSFEFFNRGKMFFHLKFFYRIQKEKKFSFPTKFEWCFCFEFTILWNLFLRKSFLCVCSFGPRRTVCTSGKQQSLFLFCECSCWIWVHLTDLTTGKSNWRRVVLSEDLISIEFSWTFQTEWQNLFQVSTVNS